MTRLEETNQSFVLLPVDPARYMNLSCGRQSDRAVHSHVHGGLELSIVLRGQYEVGVGNFVARLGPGEVILTGMWEPHRWRFLKVPTDLANFIFSPDAVEEDIIPGRHWMEMVAVPPKDRPQVKLPAAKQRVMEVARELWRELAENRPNRHVMVRLGLLRLLVEMERGWLSPRHPRGEPGPEASPLRRVRPALNLANRVAGRAPAPRQAAAACGLGLTTFNILFRETIGISFGRFCMRVRIGYVARRLATSDLPVEAIAGEAGFVDASHLHRNFVKYLHMTPAAYRQHREVSPHVALAQAMGSLLLPLDIDVPEGQS